MSRPHGSSSDNVALFLDAAGKVRWLTTDAQSLTGIQPSDIGRAIRDLTLKFHDPALVHEIEAVLNDLTPRHAEIRVGPDRCYLRCILPCRAENDRIEGVVITLTDITEGQTNERRQEVLMAELQHRVKNILASVQAIARMTHQRAGSLQEFWDSFQGRLIALAGTQELLTRAKLERVGITDLIERELSAQGANPQDYRVAGPDLALSAKAAENLALALHELTTNAAKHGALAREGGHVEVTWKISDGRVHFEWIEAGGPPVVQPERHGFGIELIQKAIPYQLRAKTNLEFSPEGLRWKLDFPLSGNVAETALEAT